MKEPVFPYPVFLLPFFFVLHTVNPLWLLIGITRPLFCRIGMDWIATQGWVILNTFFQQKLPLPDYKAYYLENRN